MRVSARRVFVIRFLVEMLRQGRPRRPIAGRALRVERDTCWSGQLV
jgi:hypothetical protein